MTGDGNDILRGNDADNVLYGMRGNDTLYGGNGNDTLAGGQGNDMLYGGTGADRYLFAPANISADGGLGQDAIAVGEFVTNKDGALNVGEDIIDLAGMFKTGEVSQANFAQYLGISADGRTLQIDRDGAGANYAMTSLVTFSDLTMTSAELLNLAKAGQVAGVL